MSMGCTIAQGHVLVADWSIAPFRCGHHDVMNGEMNGQQTNQLSGRIFTHNLCNSPIVGSIIGLCCLLTCVCIADKLDEDYLYSWYRTLKK